MAKLMARLVGDKVEGGKADGGNDYNGPARLMVARLVGDKVDCGKAEICKA